MMNSTARKRPPVNGCTDFNGRVWREELLSLALSMHGRCGEGSNEYGVWSRLQPLAGMDMEDRGRLRLHSASAATPTTGALTRRDNVTTDRCQKPSVRRASVVGVIC